MADNEQNEEYQFADLDTISPVNEDEEMATPTPMGSERASTSSLSDSFANPVRRNIAILVGSIIIIMMLYKFFGSWFSSEPAKTPIQPQPPVITPIQVSPPVVTVPPPPVPDDLQKKISVLEVGQDSIKSDIATLQNQYGTINGNVSDLSNHITQLNQQISQLTASIEQQSQEIASLRMQRRTQIVKRVARRPVTASLTYYIQAVIPGRAWLIASNGSTLTVREGSAVPGYGLVRLIDPNQGRVVMSSGRVIRFSQDDS